MSVFNETIRRKGQAEEDIFFAKLDLELIAELHKNNEDPLAESEQLAHESGYKR
ncbi:MAG: hypothetical protein QNK26_03635 [Moritella sp.]|uniref:hypothetical protein n=1 Tax=Moritella sp. TaxID=78556 RepID=UPI0029A71802|nr:hypothetical protein [Moritella sp.]MDX2319673.1 hypothetical protein [Moritella sp.]